MKRLIFFFLVTFFAFCTLSSNLYAQYRFIHEDSGMNKSDLEDLATVKAPGYSFMLVGEGVLEISQTESGRSFAIECDQFFPKKGNHPKKCYSIILRSPNNKDAAKSNYTNYMSTLEDILKNPGTGKIKKLQKESAKMHLDYEKWN